MFHTYPESRVHIPDEWSANGRHVWEWIEIGVQAPCFIVEGVLQGGAQRRVKQFISADLRAWLNPEPSQGCRFQLLAISRLTPALFNKLGRMTLDPISEVWADKSRTYVRRYILADGTICCEPGINEHTDDPRADLVFQDRRLINSSCTIE